MARNIDTSLLRAFVAVAETAGMTSAANVLSLTQAAVSQQIKRLEEGFGTLLFERDRRGLRLTSAGERLLGKAKRLLALNDEIWSEMTTPIHVGEIRFGLPYDLVGPYLPAILKGFAAAHPKVQISLACESSVILLDMVANGSVDVALIEEHGATSGETLAIEPLRWVGAKGGDAHMRRPLPMSMGLETCIFRPILVAALSEAEIPWYAMSAMGTDAMNATVETDLAVMTLLDSTVPAHLDLLGPESGLPRLPAFSINLHLPRGGGTAIARELAGHVRASFRTRQLKAA